jgi:hypothetical protein
MPIRFKYVIMLLSVYIDVITITEAMCEPMPCTKVCRQAEADPAIRILNPVAILLRIADKLTPL